MSKCPELFEQFGVETTARSDRFPISLEKRGVTSQIFQPAEHAAEGAVPPVIRLGLAATPGGTLPAVSNSRAQSAQVEFWERLTIYTESIVSKLDGCGRSDIADDIRHCHCEVSYRRCRGCSTVSKFYNRCEHKWCPLCAPRLSRERKDSVAMWTREVKQTKHVVLTCRNSEVLTKTKVQWFKKCFSRLRRTVFAAKWRGGFYSLEVTNESRGWHLHLHALIDADWIDQGELARQWAKIVGQDFAIVYVTGKQEVNYVAEVSKYLVKGSVLAKWSGVEIAAFVDAFQGVRCFGVFGSLLGQRAKVRELIKALLAEKPACECGCKDFEVLSPNELEEFMLTRFVKFREYETAHQPSTRHLVS